MTCLFTVFGPRQHVFKNNDSKMTDLGQKGNNVFIVVLVFLTVFFSPIPVKIEYATLKLAFTIPAGAPITVANDAVEMLPVGADKTTNDLSK